MTTNTELMVPTIHLNGTSREELLNQHMTALEKLREAEVALAEAYPNGRDYYVQGPNATNKAIAIHRQRMIALHKIMEDMTTIIEALDK